MVKVNMLELYDKVPPPPADPKEAYARCDHGVNESPTVCNPDKFYQPIFDKSHQLTKRIEETSMKLTEPLSEKAKNIDAEEVRKKMETMSQAEKIQYAMELNKQMDLGQKAMTLEPPSVTAAIQEYSKVNSEAGRDMQKAGEESRKNQQIQEERRQKHADIEEWTRKELEKIPQLSTGEMSYPEPKAEHALLLKSAEKHCAVENEYLKSCKTQFQSEMDKAKKRYAALQQKMAAAGYGEEAKNLETKRMLIGAQALMLAPVEALAGMSRDATKEAAGWYAKKLEVEKQKPQ
jgi:hypothetical protein